MMQAAEEININRRDAQQALAGNMDALEAILATPLDRMNQATAQFLLDEVTPALLQNPQNHYAMTLNGFAKSILRPNNANTPDAAAALRCYEQAAEMGNAIAMGCAANCYAFAKGTQQDLTRAAKYFRQALKILGNHQRISSEFDTMINRFQCPDEACYHYWVHNPKAAGKSLERARKSQWFYLNQLFYDQDPSLSKEFKIQCTKLLFPGEEDWNKRIKNAAHHNLFIAANIAIWEINNLNFEEILKFAIECHTKIVDANDSDISALILHDTIQLAQARLLTPVLDIYDSEQVLEVINMLLSIKTLSEANYWLADIVMKLDTAHIFLNHKDKYRLILSLLSKVSEKERELCPEYNMWLKQAIASLKQIQSAFASHETDETVYISFNQLLKLLPGYNNPQVLYSPRLECELLQAEKFQQALQKHYGDSPIVTFEFLIYKSYNDCFEQLDLNYLHNRLLNLLLDRVIPKTPAVVAKKTEFEALVIDSGNAGLGRKRGLLFRDIRLATEAHLHDLALKAIELAIADFNIPANRNGFYIVFFNKQLSDANKLLAECKENLSFKDVITLIVTHLQNRHTHLNKGTFRLALLERLVEVLNLGKIERLATEPETFCNELCAILKDQCQQRTVAPPAFEEKKDEAANNNNNN